MIETMRLGGQGGERRRQSLGGRGLRCQERLRSEPWRGSQETRLDPVHKALGLGSRVWGLVVGIGFLGFGIFGAGFGV